MASVEQRKTTLRNELLTRRAALTTQQREALDASIAKAVMESSLFQEADTIFSYVSFGEEVDTLALIDGALAQGKRVAVPRCMPRTRLMEWHYIQGLDELAPAAFGILEPPANPATVALAAGEGCLERGGISLALVPGLAFDYQGFRIGYGGGYYDRFLAKFSGRTVGLVREAFLLDSLDALDVVDHFDVPVDYIATTSGVFSASWTSVSGA